MATITLDFPSFTSNGIMTRNHYKSIQVGDIAYYVNTSLSGGFTVANQSDIVTIGVVTNMGIAVVNEVNYIRITCNIDNDATPPTDDSYIFFSKDNVVNLSSLMGYYGSAKFKNNSTSKAELFALSCDVAESSK